MKYLEDEMQELFHEVDTAHDLLIVRAMQYAQAWPVERVAEGDYRQHAATWLNQETYMNPEGFAASNKIERLHSRGPKWEPTLA